jgi:rfaE bifunctional protein kinase chain/domain
VDTTGIVVRSDYRTPTKTRILGGGRHSIKQQIVRFDVEDRLELESPEQEAFRSAVDSWDLGARVAVVSDYGYGAAGPENVSTLRDAIGAEGLIVGDSRYRLGDFTGLDGATPNEEEAEVLLARTLNGDLEDIAPSVRELRSALGTRFLLITRGRHGMVLSDADGVVSIPVHGADQVADVTGAGDTVIGTFALALAAGATPLEAALLADYAGGIVVMKMGTATVSGEELGAAVARDDAPRKGALWARS